MPKSLISIQDFTKEEILHILDVAEEMEHNKSQTFLSDKVHLLRAVHKDQAEFRDSGQPSWGPCHRILGRGQHQHPQRREP